MRALMLGYNGYVHSLLPWLMKATIYNPLLGSMCQFSYSYPIAHPSVEGLLEFVIKYLPWRHIIIHNCYMRFMNWLIMIDYLLKLWEWLTSPAAPLAGYLVHYRQFDHKFWLWSWLGQRLDIKPSCFNECHAEIWLPCCSISPLFRAMSRCLWPFWPCKATENGQHLPPVWKCECEDKCAYLRIMLVSYGLQLSIVRVPI